MSRTHSIRALTKPFSEAPRSRKGARGRSETEEMTCPTRQPHGPATHYILPYRDNAVYQVVWVADARQSSSFWTESREVNVDMRRGIFEMGREGPVVSDNVRCIIYYHQRLEWAVRIKYSTSIHRVHCSGTVDGKKRSSSRSLPHPIQDQRELRGCGTPNPTQGCVGTLR